MLITNPENKKGQLAITTGIAVVIGIFLLALIILIATFVSSSWKWIVVGGALIAGAIYITARAETGNKFKAVFAISLLAVGVIAILASGVLQETYTPSKYVEAPQFGYIGCEPTGSSISSSVFLSDTDGKTTVGCYQVGPTSNCILTIKKPDLDWYQFNRRMVVTDLQTNSIIRSMDFNKGFGSTAIDIQIATLTPGTYITPHYYEMKWEYQNIWGDWKADAPINYFYDYQPYVIKKYDTFSSANGQAITSIGKTSCTLSSTVKSDVVKSSSIDFSAKEGTPNILEPNERYTYFTRHVTIPSFSTGTNVAGAYCVPTASGATLYSIETVTTDLGTYNIVSPSYSEVVKNVECCNGESIPGYTCQNNIRIKIEEAECSIFKPCPNDQFQRDTSDISGLSVIRYVCKSGKCISETKQVNCTLNQQCNAGEICVNFNCKETCVGCNVNNTCGDGICQSYENAISCKSDCYLPIIDEDTCSWYQTQKTTTEKVGIGPLGIGKLIGLTKPVTTTYCATSDWILYSGIGAIVLILGGYTSYLLFGGKKVKTKGVKKRR